MAIMWTLDIVKSNVHAEASDKYAVQERRKIATQKMLSFVTILVLPKIHNAFLQLVNAVQTYVDGTMSKLLVISIHWQCWM
jgi:hypothetical protein